MTYAFKQIPVDHLNSLLQQFPQESEEFRADLEKDLIYLGTFGLEDPIREEAYKPIHMIRYGHDEVESDQRDSNQVNVRLVTGDHLNTAKYVAMRCGIIGTDEDNIEGICLTGE